MSRKNVVLLALCLVLLFCGSAAADESPTSHSSPWYAAGHLGIVTTSNLVDDSGVVISGGIVTPPDRRPDEVKETPRILTRTRKEEKELADGPRQITPSAGT